MTLGFSQQINGKPNYFIEKIWAAIKEHKLTGIEHIQFDGYKWEYKEQFGEFWPGLLDNHKPKLHTIRRDTDNKWKAGNKIHPVINNRTANRFQFAPVIKCVSTQRIAINYTESVYKMPYYQIDNSEVMSPSRSDYDYHLTRLAINDGFNGIDDFLAYFNTDFTGKIIHWTDLKY